MFCSAFAAAQEFSGPDEFGGWVEHYYESPNPERLPDALAFACARFDPYAEHGETVATFLATALSRTPGMIGPTMERGLALPQGQTPLALLTAWLCPAPEARTWLEHAAQIALPGADTLLSRPRPDLLSERIVSVFHLDALWAMFLATGDQAPVDKIMTALPLSESRDQELWLVGEAAAWSLAANAREHPLVRAMLEQRRDAADGRLRERLDEILARADEPAEEYAPPALPDA